ncbi:MAG: DUF3638 domain-containing protein [Tatlockia sp.]|nr:DUF3638 domain-containing protein [Tatlockia sp.]
MTIEIFAKLFAHVENDAHLAGTFNLQGMPFTETIKNLQLYLKQRQSSNKPNPEIYETILASMDYLVSINNQLTKINGCDTPFQLNNLGNEIADNLFELKLGESRPIPGGWLKEGGGGHAMIYQFTRTADGFVFKVINSGAGIGFHQKKSAFHKELFNPTMNWHFPFPTNGAEKREVGFFIGRLLAERIASNINFKKKPASAKRLYKEVLPSISHIGGHLIEADLVPDFAYTSGIISGTCAQHGLHQTLKINSSSQKEYVNFIFDYKHYILKEYAEACLNGSQPFTSAVKLQINLAIENNLKIINTPEMFSEMEMDTYAQELQALSEKVNNAEIMEPRLSPVIENHLPQLWILETKSVAPTPQFSMPTNDINTAPPILLEAKDFLVNLKTAVKNITTIVDPASAYFYIEALILALPTNLADSIYSNITLINHFESFGYLINDIQKTLYDMQQNWLKEEQLPALNIMNLKLMTLQMKIQATIAKTKKLPTFERFVRVAIRTVVSNTVRNPFWGTNHPELDKILIDLQNYQDSEATHSEYYSYYKELLATESKLNSKLKVLYDEKYGSKSGVLHEEIKRLGLQSLFMISQHFTKNNLDNTYRPIISLVEQHLSYESKLRRDINPFFKFKLLTIPRLEFKLDNDKRTLCLYSPLYPTSITWRRLSHKLNQPNLTSEDSPALKALTADAYEFSAYHRYIETKSANRIQLYPPDSSDQKGKRSVTQADIVARDYLHLRAITRVQIPLTLDYFTRNIGKLANADQQYYVEANLMQPGLLKESLEIESFLPQFDAFIKKGTRFFNKNGQYTAESLFFLRLDFLVSRYLYLTNKGAGLSRLQGIQDQLSKQLSQPNDQEIVYVQKEYFFLTLMTQMSVNEKSAELFTQATEAYFYIQSHANPNIHKGLAHRVDIEAAISKFQCWSYQIARKNPEAVKQTLQNIMSKQASTKDLEYWSGNFPEYVFRHFQSRVTVNFFLGKFFENNLARTSLPLAIKNHPLIKHLGLETQQECLMSADGNYLVLPHKTNEIQLFYNNKSLIVQKKWQIDGSVQNYELHALSVKHLANHASESTPSIQCDLPAILKDNSMDFWRNTKSPECGLLVKNNCPLYYYKNGDLYLIDKKGNLSDYRLSVIDSKLYSTLNDFESNQFILAHKNSAANTVIKLPRYNLDFYLDNNKALILQETCEKVVDRPDFIHPSISGLTLEFEGYSRFIMPIARFYPSDKDLNIGDYYRMVHDKEGKIAAAFVELAWKRNPPLRKTLWDYENSEKQVSFRIQEGELIADNVADSLYLAYVHLSTHQAEKAWKILDDCNIRLGGLTGNPAELQYISWICERLPKGVLTKNKKSFIKTPPYVACRLKAQSLLSDYLLQDRKFDLNLPKHQDKANSEYAQIEHQQLINFVDKLPQSIYENFSDLQKMRRHLEHSYTLSNLERKRLLDFYQGSQSGNEARGALGYEWLCLSLATIQDEREALQAKIETSSLTECDKNRLELIDKRLSELKPVRGLSTILETVKIDLSLSGDAKVNQDFFSKSTKKVFEKWSSNLADAMPRGIGLDKAVSLLSSSMIDDEFITHFPAYFEIAFKSENIEYTKRLSDFCTKILIANRHIPLDCQGSNIPLLANILYRIMNNKFALMFCFTRKEDSNLTQIINLLSSVNVPDIEVYQAKDIYKDILATPEEILKKERSKPTPLKTNNLENTSFLEQSDIKNYLDSQNRQPLDELIIHYRNLNKQSALSIANENTEAFAGKEILALEQAQKSLSQKLLDNQPLTSLIQSLFNEVEHPLAEKANQTWSLALQLANQGPSAFKNKQSWNLEIQSKARSILSQSDLLSIFCRADATYTIEKTGITVENAQNLHDLIHKALFEEIQSLLIKNMKTDFNKAITENDPDLAMQVLDFLTKEAIPGMDNPATVVLQKAEAMLLRPRQVEALDALLKPRSDGRGVEDKIEKIIPGGGKTKVILPIYAEKIAKGDNLVVVEVPSASLATNHVDLNRYSQRLFGKRAYRFEFDRDSNSCAKRLKEIYELFNEIMTSRCYMVTTGDSIKALELKYIELLLQNKKDRDDNWQSQVYWLDKICDLLHNYTDALIDEVHLGLWFKRKLIYTTGESRPLSQALIQNALALYSYIDTDFIKNAPKLPNDYNWSGFKQGLAKKIISDQLSPLNPFFNLAVKNYGANVEAELIDYVLGTSIAIPEAVLHANAEDKAAIAFYKQEISSVLKDTLCRKLNVKYGASKRENITATEATLAIPYLGNMIPNEQSRFGNELVSVNTTIQKMLIEGISKALLADQISAWQVLARQELSQNSSLKHLNETPTARGFALIEGNSYTLSDFDVNNEEQMTALHQKYKENRSLQFSLLKDRIINQIHQDSGFIQSDAFNHVDIYRSAQGTSGTPGKETKYHQRLKFNNKSSLGTDAYVVELLRHKNTELSHEDYKDNPEHYLQKILFNSKAGARTRAIVDINATFTGVTNLEVAQTIASFTRSNPKFFSHDLKYVLYFNADQVLCALTINKPEVSIILGTSDEKEISRLLRISPAERFTYYDQVHTVGTDIRQYDEAHAHILMDIKEEEETDTFDPFAQGNLRMRRIGQRQTNELILPTRVKGLQYNELIERLIENQQKALPLDNLFSAKAQMTNLLRRTCLNMIQNLPSEKAEEKANLAQQFELFFKEVPSQDLFALYGAINKKQKIGDIFKTFKNQLLDLWKECNKKAFIELTDTKLKDIKTKLQIIIDTATPNCLEEYEELLNAVAKEVQIQKMIQKQVERVELKAFFDPKLSEAYQRSWCYFGAKNELTVPIHIICGQDVSFSPNLKVSRNYAETYLGQSALITEKLMGKSKENNGPQQTLNAFLKPVFLVWYHFTNNDQNEKILEAIIVTPQEANAIANHFPNDKNNWISTTLDTVVAGKRPEAILDKKVYQSLREQVRFFNGDFLSLLEQETPLIWLKENTEEKLNFFESKLQCYRPDCELGLHQLKTALTQANVEGFVHIAEHPFKDLTQTDWKSLFPKTIPAQAAEYKRAAEAFHYMNKHWLDKDLVVSEIEQQFGLAMSSLGYIDDHLKSLTGFKQLIKETYYFEQPFLQRLPKDDPKIRAFLGISLEKFYERQGIDPNKTETEDLKWLEACLAAVNHLRAHPALADKKDPFALTIDELTRLATKSEFLDKIVKEETLSNNLIRSILLNKCCDESIQKQLINLDFPFDHQTLVLFAKKFTNLSLVELLLQKNLDNATHVILCNNPHLLSTHLLKILNKTESVCTLEKIFNHPAADHTVQEALFKHKSFTSALAKSLINKQKLKPEAILQILKNPKAVNEDLLICIFESFNSSPEIQLAVLKHHECTTKIKLTAIELSSFSPELASEMIKTSPNSTFYGLHKKLIKNIFKSNELSEEWEKILIAIIKTYDSESLDILHLLGIIQQNASLISPAFALVLFNRFGDSLFDNPVSIKTIYYNLPFAGMLEIADKETLKKITDYEETRNLSKDFLRLLSKKCNEENLFAEFLKRKDISELLDEMLLNTKQFQFNEEDLLLILERAYTSSTLSLIYSYKNASTKVKEGVLANEALSSEFLKLLFLQNQLNDEKIIEMLSTKRDFSSDLQKTIIDVTSNPNLLLSMVGPSLYTPLLSKIVEKPEFSPAIAKKILDSNLYSKDVLLQIAEIAISKVKIDKIWEPCLLQIFEINPEKINATKLKEIIQKNSANLSTNLAFHAISVFGQDMAKHLLPENMIANATESEIRILLKPNCKITEEMELWLVTRCHTKELIELLVEKPLFFEKALIALLEKSNLTEDQLFKLSIKAKSSITLKMIHNHQAATDKIKLSVYRNSNLTSALLLEGFKVKDEAWLEVLNHPGAVDKKVFAHIAKVTQIPEVLEAVIKDFRIDCDILSIAMENEQFSYKLAKWIDNSWTKWPNSFLKKYFEKAFDLSRDASQQEKEHWEQCLHSLFLRYGRYNKEEEILEIFLKEQIQMPKLGLLLLRAYGEKIVAQLPIFKMISIADTDDLRLIANKQQTGRLADEQLNLLAAQCNDFVMIDTLLQRPELSPQVLQCVLAKPLRYTSLSTALQHPNFSPADQQTWLENMAKWEKTRKNELLNSPNTKLKLSSALDALRLKACQHAVKALSDDKYEPVAREAINLYQKLNQEVEDYLSKRTNVQDFQKNCKVAINYALPVLGEHRGYKQIFMDIINAVLNVVTLRFAWSNQWRFFELKTETVEKVDEFGESLKKIAVI